MQERDGHDTVKKLKARKMLIKGIPLEIIYMLLYIVFRKMQTKNPGCFYFW